MLRQRGSCERMGRPEYVIGTVNNLQVDMAQGFHYLPCFFEWNRFIMSPVYQEHRWGMQSG